MNISDWLMIFSVLLAPVIAVQVSQYLERRRLKSEGQLKIFKTLMATRATQMAPGHVEALNMIDIEFAGKSNKEKKVIEAWKAYLDLLAEQNLSHEAWVIRKTDLLVELLYSMGICVGYNFDKTHIKNTSYFPKGYGDLENDQFLIRKGMLGLLKNEIALPVYTANATKPNVEQLEEKDTAPKIE